MDTRKLGVIQRSIPLLLRHVDGYIEMAQRDWALVKANGMLRLQCLAMLAVSGSFFLLLACALVIALTWDGDYRVLAIALLAGLFAFIAIVSGILLTRKREQAFSGVRREWREDRELISHLLSGDGEHREDPSVGFPNA